MSKVNIRGSNKALRGASALALLASATLVSGCMSSPTYGTGKTANAQLMDDLSNALNPVPKRAAAIDYKPRPEIVEPASEAEVQAAGLPAPQDSLATASNPAWPESPEQRRARIRAEATATRDNPDFDPEVELGVNKVPSMAIETRGTYNGTAYVPTDTNKQRAEVLKRRRENQQGAPTERKFLSEPPLDYRVPAASAPADEIGEDELKKEARRRSDARKKDGKTSWRDLVPWL